MLKKRWIAISLIIVSVVAYNIYIRSYLRFENFKTAKELRLFLNDKFPAGSDIVSLTDFLKEKGASCRVIEKEHYSYLDKELGTEQLVQCSYNTGWLSFDPMVRYSITIHSREDLYSKIDEEPINQQARIEIRAKEVYSTDYYHLFIIHTDSSGRETLLRGGPGFGGMLFGNIEIIKVPYHNLSVEEPIDYVKDALRITIGKGTDEEVFALIERMWREAQRINSERYDYKLPTGIGHSQNGNTTVKYMVEAAGLKLKIPFSKYNAVSDKKIISKKVFYISTGRYGEAF